MKSLPASGLGTQSNPAPLVYLADVTGSTVDGVQTSTTTPNGGTTTEILDDLNRVVETDQPAPAAGQTAPVWKFTLDLDGEMTQELDPLGRTQTDTFDGMGRETNDVSFTGVNTATAYNNLSEITSVTVGTGSDAEATTNTWDALGRETAVQDALLGTTQMAFDLDGFMTALTDSDNNTTTWVRDNLERVTSEQNQLGYSRLYSWDPASNLIQETDRDARVRDFTVNHLNETTAEQWMQGSTVVNTIATGYNADGEVTSAGDNYSNYAFAYDGQGHLASVDNAGTPGVPDVVLASQFDGQGDRTSLAATVAGVKDFLNSYSYDTLSRLTSIEQQGQTGGNAVNPKTIDFGYDGIGDITQIYRMNSVGMGPNPQSDPADSAISYNPLGQLTGITPSHNGVNIDPLSWTYDTLDRAGTFTNDDGTATYGYNLDSELTSVSYTGATEPPDENYSFDPNGNQNETGHVVSPANQVTNDGTFTYAFDNEGNRASRTRISSDYATDHTVTYSWDYRDRLTDVEYFDNNSVLTKHVHYVYGVFDHLIETDVDPTGGGTYTVITHNIYDLSKPVVTAEDATQPVEPGLMISAAGDVVLQINGSQQLTERILNGPITSAYDAVFTALAQDNIASGNTYWFLLNNQGTFMDAVDANGDQVDHAEYTGFGELDSETNSAIPHITGFAGGLTDAYTGLVNFLHRWYDSLATVWLSVDPSGFRAGDPNLNRYVGNLAPGRADPTGLQGEDWVGDNPDEWGWNPGYHELNPIEIAPLPGKPSATRPKPAPRPKPIAAPRADGANVVVIVTCEHPPEFIGPKYAYAIEVDPSASPPPARPAPSKPMPWQTKPGVGGTWVYIPEAQPGWATYPQPAHWQFYATGPQIGELTWDGKPWSGLTAEQREACNRWLEATYDALENKSNIEERIRKIVEEEEMREGTPVEGRPIEAVP